ncbi:hypothetical protein [Streptacidiphilus neutrinimicus]|uniref:hypothetical protein n=1 Tax=Streptacidiphilus neutrinimicus TaxID=105420 RepID=UPI00126A6F25|nr:hypothetical protein [Streptacidiphilus neutrinimicus]
MLRDRGACPSLGTLTTGEELLERLRSAQAAIPTAPRTPLPSGRGPDAAGALRAAVPPDHADRRAPCIEDCGRRYRTDAHHTLGALAGLLEQLPLTLHQAAAALNAMPENQLAVLSDPPVPARVQAQIATEFGHAIAAQEAAAHLRRAQHAAAELVYTGPIGL